MKKIIITASLLFIILQSSAQNTFPTSGNVGIGTTSPTTNLEIKSSTSGWLFNIRATAINPEEINGIRFYSGYIGDLNKWAGIGSVVQDIHSNNTGLSLYTNTTEKLRILGNGNVGIGTTLPAARLTIHEQNQLQTIAKSNNLLFSISATVGTNYLKNNVWIIRNQEGSSWQTARLHDGISIDGSFLNPQIDTRTWWERDPNNNIQSWGDQQNTYMSINKGNVSIGTANANGYKLAVNGNIHAKEVKIDIAAESWPDYVFKKDYNLKPLTEVETYVNRNHHLPDVPSAEKMEKDGVLIGEMNKLLIRKIEELTLYVIEQNKKLELQQKVNQDLHERLKKIEDQK